MQHGWTLGAFLLASLASLESQALEIDWYGFLKAEMIYDTNRAVTPGNFVVSVPDETLNEHFGLTANASRLGFKLTAEETENYKAYGCGEIDFWGNSDAKSFTNAKNQPNPRMRLAYAGITQKKLGFTFQAGQMTDILSPLTPKTINHAPLYQFGNLGDRRPMFMLGEILGNPKRYSIELKVSAFQPSPSTGTEPGYQAALNFTFPGFTSKPASLHLSGAYGFTNEGSDDQGKTIASDEQQMYVLSAGLKLPVWKLTLQVEGFTGQNAKIFQGISLPNQTEWGGFTTLTLQPIERLSFNLGASADLIEKDSRLADRVAYNTVFYGNVYFNLTKSLAAAVEVTRWSSAFAKNDGDNSTYSYDDLRTELALILTF